jgi:hypothetical protein
LAAVLDENVGITLILRFGSDCLFGDSISCVSSEREKDAHSSELV